MSVPDIEGLNYHIRRRPYVISEGRSMAKVARKFRMNMVTVRNSLSLAGWTPEFVGGRIEWAPPKRPWPAPEDNDEI